MTRGGKPRPLPWKILEGNPGQRKLNFNEPQSPKGIPEPPDSLCELARKEWESIAPGLMAMGVLTQVDKLVLTGYCQAFADYERAREGLNLLMASAPTGHSSGIFIASTKAGGHKKSPLFAVAVEAATLALRFAAELGLTPSARTRLSISPQDTDQSDLKGLLYVEKK